jgi:hypothetical protein
MPAGVECGHLSELKKLALSCDDSLLHDVPDDVGWIAKRLVKNWWVKHGLPYCMQKMEEENRVSFIVMFFVLQECIIISLACFLLPEAEEDPKGDSADKDVNIIGDDVQMETEATERHAEAEMPMMEVPTANAADIPDEAETPRQLEV